MLTYDLSKTSEPIYLYLYKLIKSDISTGKLEIGQKMPSKRNLAKNLGISTITVENAYEQLLSEGYIYSIPKKGYYVSDILEIQNVGLPQSIELNIKKPNKKIDYKFDFSSGATDSNNFPFSVWAKLIREVISKNEEELLEISPCEGVYELRHAIANHLSSYRGMNVDPDQIIVGAGTEYLYGLLIKLVGGKGKRYCIENPGYKKLKQIYESNEIKCTFVPMDNNGISIEKLRELDADIAHISPNHHFPTGIMMPVNRRYELLSWANEKSSRYIIEDDYDSEFRINGKPLPTLQSIDAKGKVIYMNTFSKSLASTIRISYMVLPQQLANEFYKNLYFYSNTVSTFEQYTLAKFISLGFFEKHINRMRLYYGKKRSVILDIIKSKFSTDECEIIENDSGLHFLLKFNIKYSDKEFKDKLFEHQIRISSISDYYMENVKENTGLFILDYSKLDINGLSEALDVIKSYIV